MIRNEVEKLRGYLFTKEEMDEIINPILNDSRNGTYVDDEEKRPEWFIKVQACTRDGPVLHEVPTKEEYDDFRRRVGECIGNLEKRISTLEKEGQ